MKTAILLGTAMLTSTFALADPVAEHRNLASVWGGTAPDTNTACIFKSLATLFPKTTGTIIVETQLYPWADSVTKQESDTEISYGTYERRLTDSGIIKLAAENSAKKGATNPVGYYYYAWTNSMWKKVVGSANQVGSTEVLIQPRSSGSSFGEQQFKFRSATGPTDGLFVGSTSAYSVYTDSPIQVYGQQEQIPSSDLIFGVASTCTRRGADGTADGDTDADKADIFVWATYTFPAFNYQVDKSEDGFVTKMDTSTYEDDNNEIVFVYGNQPQDTPLASTQTLTPIILTANSIITTCTASITWSDKESTTTHPEKCWIQGATINNQTGDPDATHNVKEECKAGATLQCSMAMTDNKNGQTPGTTTLSVYTSVAVLEFVKIYESTQSFPYTNFENFADDGPFTNATWYSPTGVTDADPFTVLGVKSATSQFVCPTQTYSDSSVPCVTTSGGSSQTGLGVTNALLVSDWPAGSGGVVYPTVYVSMMAQVEFMTSVTGRSSTGNDADTDGTPHSNGDSTVDNGVIKMLQDGLPALKTTVTTALTTANTALTTQLAAQADVLIKAEVVADASVAKSQCEKSSGADCTAFTTALTTANNALTTANNALNIAEAAVVTRKTAIQAQRAAHNTRRLAHKKDSVLKKTIILGQHFGKHQPI